MQKKKTPPDIIGQRLYDLRIERGKTQADTAAAAGISASVYNRIEKGGGTPDADSIIKLARYYGVSSDYLLGLSDTPAVDHSLAAVCDTTGLSLKAVQRLCSGPAMCINEKNVDPAAMTVNRFLEDASFRFNTFAAYMLKAVKGMDGADISNTDLAGYFLTNEILLPESGYDIKLPAPVAYRAMRQLVIQEITQAADAVLDELVKLSKTEDE